MTLSRRWDDTVRESWLEAALRCARRYELEDEVSAAYERRVAMGVDDLEAAIGALKECGVQGEELDAA